MKQKTFIRAILFFCMFAIGSIAQAQLINPDFLSNNGNDDATLRCPTFQGGSAGGGPGTLTGWYRANGTPLLVNDCQGALAAVKMTASVGQANGQGIAQEYHFKAGVTYQICYKYTSWDISNGATWFTLTENLPISGTCGPNCECWFASTSVTGAKQDILAPTPSPAIQSTNCLEVYTNTITFTASQDFNYFAVHFNSSGFDDYDNFIVLDYVNVTRACKANPNLVISANGYVSPNYYDAYNTISAGTSFGGGGGSVDITPNAFTTFEAKSYILLKENFLAQVDDGYGFLAHINPETCYETCFIADNGTSGGDTDYDTGEDPVSKPLNITQISTDDGFTIYPNPNNGHLNITLPNTDNYNIKIVNLAGAVIYNTNVENTNSTQVDLDETIPSGSYIIQISGSRGKHIEKLTIIR